MFTEKYSKADLLFVSCYYFEGWRGIGLAPWLENNLEKNDTRHNAHEQVAAGASLDALPPLFLLPATAPLAQAATNSHYSR